jgi:isopentenyl-diphosphate delta-isomerase
MSKTQKRKLDHLDLCVNKQVETGSAWFEYAVLVHKSLPGLKASKVDASTKLLGKKLEAPLVISAITGGVKKAGKINKDLAETAEKLGIGFGVGSQRAMLEDPSTWQTYYVRDVAPNTLVLGNLGAVNNYSPTQIKKAMKKIGADAMCLHLNASQEMAQPEGDTDFTECLNNIKKAAKKMPVIAKETGNGIVREEAKDLKKAGVKGIDVGGFGGTSWVKVEEYRHKETPETLSHWGIPTAASILECRVGVPLIATGGVRSGVDAAKAIALGADSAGVALPVLKWYYKGGKKHVQKKLGSWIREFKTAMVLTGSKNVKDLKKTGVVVLGPLFEWCEARDLGLKKLASNK